MLDRRQFLTFAAALPLAAQVRKPNVIYILGEQWRAQALPSAGDLNIVAPGLARLAREGAHFPRCYAASPVCGPSRAALQTGKFPHAVKMPENEMQLPLEETCLAQQLAKAGYKTGYIGKWHLDGPERPGFVPPGPRRRGYQFWAAFNNGYSYFDSIYFADSAEPIHRNGFEPDYQTDLGMEFMERNKANPFLLFLAYGPPHHPRTPPTRTANLYKPGSIALRENVPAGSEAAVRADLAKYYAQCTAVDENIVRLLSKLDQMKLAEDTIIIFSADHGEMVGSHGIEGKNEPYEESAGIPLLVRYPRRLKAGTVEDLLVSNVDHMPTILSFCGAEIPPGVHGRDLSGLMMGREGDRPESVYCEGKLTEEGEWRMIVRGLDKMVVGRDMKVTHLYNLGQDPFELNNHAGSNAHSRLRDELAALMKRWMLRTGDRVPYPAPVRRA